MHRFLISILLFTFCSINLLVAKDNVPYLTSECDSLVLFNGLINTYNGQLVLVDQDISIDGPSPLQLTRYYDGWHNYDAGFGYSVGANYPLMLHGYDIKDSYLKHKFYVEAEQRMGCNVLFKLKEEKIDGHTHSVGSVPSKYYEKIYTNCCEALLRGEPSIYAMHMDMYKGLVRVDLGNGTTRHYKYFKEVRIPKTFQFEYYYLLDHEELANGNTRHYSYYYLKNEAWRLKRIETRNSDGSLVLNWIEFKYKAPSIFVTASNGEKVEYVQAVEKGKAKKDQALKRQEWEISRVLLKKAALNGGSFTEYEPVMRSRNPYTLFATRMVKKPDGRYFSVKYNIDEQIKELFVPGEEEPIYTFQYYPKSTFVKDCYGNKQEYIFSNNSQRLNRLKELHRIQDYSWDDKGQLRSHQLYDGKELLSTRSYSYDEKGNVLEVTLQGAITEKKAADIDSTHYTYTSANEVLTKTRNNVLTTYKYERHQLSKQLTSVEGEIQERAFFSYDKNAILIEKIVDDGSSSDKENLTNVTTRHITTIEPQLNPELDGFTLPHSVTEWSQNSTGQKQLLKRVEKLYTQGSLLSEEKVFDANDTYQYSLLYTYDTQRRLIKKTNALSIETLYAYDDNHNRIYKEKNGKKIYYTYDLCNRLIEERLECDDQIFITTHRYDALGNRLETTDPYGQTTHFEYDSAGREIATTDPLGYKELKQYNAQNLITHTTDKNGYLTETDYNIFEDPLEIRHPDGSKQSFQYNVQGDLIKETYRDGSYIIHTVDYQGRPLISSTYSKEGELLKSETKRYKGAHLIQSIDALGYATDYAYDAAGRLVEKKEGERSTRYTYDALGRLYSTTCENTIHITEYDLLDRPIEERTEDILGTVYRKVQFGYDNASNRTLIREYSAPTQYSETHTIYNAQKQPILERDALGHEKRFTYFHTDHLEIETLEVSGRRTVEIFDALKRIKEKQTYSIENTLIAHSLFSYDGQGQQTVHEEKQLLNGTSIGSYFIETAYDSMGQKISQTEQQNKTTRWSYENGQLTTLELPHGICIAHLYDGLGRLSAQLSTDGTLDVRFSYDANDNLLTAQERIHNTQVERCYDRHNRLTYEKEANGTELFFAYDDHNRLIQTRFNEHTVDYRYSPAHLLSCSYNRQPFYARESDWQGNILSGHYSDASITYTYDALRRCRSISSPTYCEQLTYSPQGELIEISYTDVLGKASSLYNYDPLSQLLSETGPFENQYTHDSLYNRQSKNSTLYHVDTLNQVTQAESSYTYDLNGQRLSKDDNRYAYDALGHLIAHNDVQFQYDALGRRIACHTAQESTTYLYQFDQEIASFSNNACTLRLIHKEAPLAYVLNSQLYTPIHNHRGDLCQLLYDNQVCTNVRYDAFGLFELEGLFCPYLFFGQRYDTFTGLFHFAQREYDPQLGRFLTPDPLGFADGPNLYTYVKNNPHRYVDPQGLFWEESKDFFNGSCRGAIDDASWGASEYLIGSYQAPSAYATAGYYTGMGVSMAMGFFYGTTEARLAGLALRHIPQVAKCVSAVKSLGRRTIDLVKHSSVVEKTSSFVKNLFTFGKKTNKTIVKEEVLCLDKLSKAGTVADREGLTRAGRAIDKHGGRLDDPFPKPFGNEVAKNTQGQFHLDDILTHPNNEINITRQGYIEIYAPDKRGARFRQDGFFMGFIKKRD